VTPEGRVIGSADVTWEWEGTEDERTAGVTEVAGVPVVESNGLRGGVPPGGGAPSGGAAAPAVTTSVDGAGNKRTVEHEVNMTGTVSGGTVERLRRVLEGAEEAMERLNTR
jgi:hypothetical protein